MPSYRIDGEGFSDTSGYSVRIAGDVTGDGIDDLLVSAYGGDPGGRFDAGEFYLLSGADLAALDIADGTADFVIQLANINATGTSYRFNGTDAGDRAGFSVAGIGDLDNDGRVDIAISAPRRDTPNGPNSGETYLISGADLQALDNATANGGTPGDGTIELADVAASRPGSYQVNGAAAGDHAASVVTYLSDFNGDGITDVVIGVGDAHSAYILSGGHLGLLDGNGDGVIELADAPLADTMFSIGGGTANLLGLLADGSTLGNLLISAIEADPNGEADAGQVYLIDNSDVDALDDSTANGGTADDGMIEEANIASGASSYQFNGSDAGDLVGRGVAFVGDVTGDGIEDFLIGAPGADPNGAADAGEAYLISGADLPALDAADGVVDGIIEIANVAATGTSYQFNGETAGDNAGWSVSEVGDVDGDGLADLLIGAPFSDAGGADSGAVYFISGGDLAALDAADGTVDGIIGLENVAASGAASYQINGIDPGDWAGLSIDGNGDPTNDTVNDLLIGAQRADPNGNSGAGETYLLSGSDLAFLDAADGTSDGVIDLENANTECFLAGTRIATPGGEVAVESLAIGDSILTADRRSVAVKWIGRRTVYPRFGFDGRLEPVCISAGALGRGRPHRDLFVSADHGMVVDGLVINASALVNGTTIRFVPAKALPSRICYFHIETEAHSVILANGAPAETFVDYLGRQAFDNYPEYLALYGADRVIPEMEHPRISSSRLLPAAIRARFAGSTPASGSRVTACA